MDSLFGESQIGRASLFTGSASYKFLQACNLLFYKFLKFVVFVSIKWTCAFRNCFYIFSYSIPCI